GPVVVDLLVRTARHALTPAAALVLVDEDNAVLLTLVDGAGRTGCHARRVEAVLAKPRQVHHEGVLELAEDLLLHALEIGVLRALGELATQNLLPVGAPLDLLHALTRDERARTRSRRRLELRCRLQVLVVEGEGLVVIVDLGQIGVGEDLGEHAPFAADLGLQRAVGLSHPTAVPAPLVLPILGMANPRFGLDVVEPRLPHALAVGPNVLAGDRASVTADAFVEVQHHRDLCADFHFAASILGAIDRACGGSQAGRSSQSTFALFPPLTNSSRLVPMVP